MAKTSKTVPQKEAASSSRSAGEKPVVEPHPEELIPGCFSRCSRCLDVGTVPHLENWVRSLVSTSTHTERAWHDLSKGRWEARTRGLGKDVTMRPSSGDEEVSSPISKLAKENKRKRVSNFEGQKPKKQTAHKPKGNTIPLTMESVQRLREEEEEEEEKKMILGELSQYEVDNRGLTEERYAFKLLSEQREGEAKGLRAELEAAQKEQADLAEQVKIIFEVNDTDSGVTANSSIPQVQQKLDVIGHLREEVDVVKAEAEAWKKNMDRLALEKEAARAQLASAKTQLRSLKEKALVQAKKIEEFQSRLGSATSDRERLATELAAAKSEVKTAKANADAMVAVYRSDAEAAQVRAKEVAEAAQARANWIHARGFDLTAEIENAKELEDEARVLAFSDDNDSRSMSGSESGEGLESEDAALGED
ncbi:uncharacterized protein [Nicotiana tomentosiformis]|uniref:uncharacterized protein n=1 Tax=Nicotiana tomentosiformis TaxID=4098 RepID=UPI00388CAD55